MNFFDKVKYAQTKLETGQGLLAKNGRIPILQPVNGNEKNVSRKWRHAASFIVFVRKDSL